MNAFVNLWTKIRNLGLSADMSTIETKLNSLTNLFVLVCIPLAFFYTTLNFFQGIFILSAINFCITLNLILTLYYQSQKKHKISKFILLYSNAFFLTLSAFIYKNGAELYLITILSAIIILTNDRRKHIYSTLIFSIIILFIQFVPIELPDDQIVNASRKIMNTAGGFATLFLTIIFFKHIQYTYHKELEEKNRLLKSSNANMEKVLSILAHDIREPLSSIPALIELYENNYLSQDATSTTFKTINRKILDVDHTLISLLEWSAKNLKEIKAFPTKIKLYDLITQVLEIIELQIENKNIKFELTISADHVIYADRDQMIIILRNIIGNAIKFSKNDGLIKIKSELMENDMIIKIIDFGIGIEKNVLQNLTDKAQIPAYGTNGERGTGIGLLLCHELIKQNHGDFNFVSNHAVGTKVEIHIPSQILAPQV